ncbi:MAG: NUDIX hydrolase [Kocuria sp.]|nr:NUDIX hydrolase [Kocuria sp.]
MSSHLPEEELKVFIDSLPTRRLASAAVIRDDNGRVLVVEPNYKDGWTLPGGTTEAGEDPRTGCFREVLEEVGLNLPPGRLLLVSHGIDQGIWGDSVYFLYDGGCISSTTTVTVQQEELLGYEWVEPERLDQYLPGQAAQRVRAAIACAADGTTAEVGFVN